MVRLRLHRPRQRHSLEKRLQSTSCREKTLTIDAERSASLTTASSVADREEKTSPSCANRVSLRDGPLAITPGATLRFQLRCAASYLEGQRMGNENCNFHYE